MSKPYLLAGLIVILSIYHYFSIYSARHQQRAQDEQEYAVEKAKLTKQVQDLLDKQANSDNQVLQDKLDRLHKDWAKLLEMNKPKIVKVFASNCVANNQAIADVNASR